MKKVKGEHGIICRKPNSKFGYFGWPSVTKTGDGTLIAACSGLRKKHIGPWGRTVLFYSQDQGKNWSKPQLVNDSPVDDRDAGIINIGENNLLLSWFTSDTRQYLDNLEGEDRNIVRCWTDELLSRHLGSWVRISNNGGKSWGKARKVSVNAPHGPIVLDSGDLLYLGKKLYGKGKKYIKALKSKNKGKNWIELAQIPLPVDSHPDNFHEPHVVELPSGKLLGIIRYQHTEEYQNYKDFSLFKTESYDSGNTWTQAVSLGVCGSPPHLINHSSGAVVCVYGYRKKPYGERAMISYDNGETWHTDYIIRADGVDGDLGYPASVELEDGSILTVYYQKYESGEQTSLLYTRWQLP